MLLSDEAIKFIKMSKSAVSLVELCKKITGQKYTKKEAVSYCETIQDIPDIGYIDFENELYYSKYMIFGSTPFLIKLTDYEISSGKLIIGHRFNPYISEIINVSNVSLLYKDTQLQLEAVEMDQEDCQIYYSAMSVIYFAHYLLTDGMITVHKIDISSIIDECNFTMDDRLLITPTDFENMQYSISVIKGDELKIKHFKMAYLNKKIYNNLIVSIQQERYPSIENLAVSAYGKSFVSGDLKNIEYLAPFSSEIFNQFIMDGHNVEMGEVGYVYLWLNGDKEPKYLNMEYDELFSNGSGNEGLWEDEDWNEVGEYSEEDGLVFDDIDDMFKKISVPMSSYVIDGFLILEALNGEKYNFNRLYNSLFSNYDKEYFGDLCFEFLKEECKHLNSNAKKRVKRHLDYFQSSKEQLEYLVHLGMKLFKLSPKLWSISEDNFDKFSDEELDFFTLNRHQVVNFIQGLVYFREDQEKESLLSFIEDFKGLTTVELNKIIGKVQMMLPPK